MSSALCRWLTVYLLPVSVVVLLATPGCAGVVIDEILPLGASLGRGETAPYVKLYNRSSSAADIAGWRLTDRTGNVLYALPPLSLPPRGYLVIRSGSGDDDLDFSEGFGVIHSGAVLVFQTTDEMGLYSGLPAALTLVDFVCWTQNKPFEGGFAYTHAISRGLWASDDYLDLSLVPGGASLGRLPSGRDTDSAADWGVIVFHARLSQAHPESQNPFLLQPADGSLLQSGVVAFSFEAPAWGERFNLQIDDAPDFATPVIDLEFTPPGQGGGEVSPAQILADGDYWWRVRVKPPGQPYLSEAAVWTFAVESGQAESAVRDGGIVRPAVVQQTVHGVARRIQHKDSRLVCLWDQHAFAGGGVPHTQNPQGRPGCDPFRLPGQYWDAAHDETQAHVASCGHCAFYCARACTQMVNHFYGGDLFQDRISYHIRSNDIPGQPEGDLGHDRGFGDDELTAALSWALQGTGVSYNPYFGVVKPSFGDYKNRLENGPMVAGVPGHVVVVDGWRELTFLGHVIRRSLHIQDPWPGARSGWFVFERWVTGNDATWHLAAGNKAGRSNEASVTSDSDGDGLMDFDEGNPRPLCSDRTKRDTDADEVEDKREVEAYTFHEERDHRSHDNDAWPPGFADVDGDGLRSECDCDSDNDSDFDGGEDIDGSGDGGMGGFPETCMFGPPFTLKIFTDRKVYLVGQTVLLTGWDLHRASTYPYDIIPGCPDLVDNQGIGVAGNVTTNAFGRFPWTPIFTCPAPGDFLAVVDVLKDSLYSEPDNWDPWTCWVCVEPRYPDSPSQPSTPCFPRISPPGTVVQVNLSVVTGWEWGGTGIYVQDPNSLCGVRLTTGPVPVSAPVGALVSFQGTVLHGSFEPTVMIAEMELYPYGLVQMNPIHLSCREVGGTALPSTVPMPLPYGPNNLCSLVQVWGRVQPESGFGRLVISDGSTVSGQPVKVEVEMGPFGELFPVVPGEFLTVTGISTATPGGGRAVTIRTPQDIRRLLPLDGPILLY
ncbi:MAG: lamin tail domain-containing protein [Armatimonadota bacterium]